MADGFMLRAGERFFMGCFGGSVEIGDEDEAYIYPSRTAAAFDLRALHQMSLRDGSIPAFIITYLGRTALQTETDQRATSHSSKGGGHNG